MRVSSRHLVLVFPVFKRLLKRGFAEGDSLSVTGTLEKELPDDDPKAFEIILNIIHGHVKKVPLKADIKLLTQICVLIDKYCFHEVAEIFYQNMVPRTFRDVRRKVLQRTYSLGSASRGSCTNQIRSKVSQKLR